MTEPVVSNKRIAKNTIMLYIRMLLSVVVSLYTSRVVLEVLGVEDYGIYGLVGGVVSMFSFLNASMSGATSRFLTYELGKGNDVDLRDTFSSALIIHIGIALVVFILAETVGLWFLSNKLVIPEGRMHAAHCVYQCSVISALLTITQVPYNSLIIAHERMSVYAYIEILNVSLKLFVVFLLTIGPFDKLMTYAILVLIVSIIIMMIYRIYCIRNFSESRFSFIWRKSILKPMLSFTGWDFYGNMCVTARVQGSNFLINNFFGVVANAASSITTTVNSVISGFAGNIITAFRPQIIKSFSQKNWEHMQSMMNNAIQFSSLFLLLLSLPILFETSFVINLWLGQIPEYIISFIRLTLIANCVGLMNSVIVIAIHATGNIKRLSYYTGTLYLLSIPVSFIFLKMGFEPSCVYAVNLLSSIFVITLNLFLLKKQINDILILPILRTILVTIVVSTLTALLVCFVHISMDEGLIRFAIVTISDVLSMIILTYFIALNDSQRSYIKRFITQKLLLKNEM